MKTVEAARGKWASILTSLGVDEKALRGRHVPCPMCGGKDRFRFDDKNGMGTWFCSQCGAGAGIEFVKRYLNVGAKQAMDRIDELTANATVSEPKPQTDQRRKKAAINVLWNGAHSIDGTLTEAYLRKRVPNMASLPVSDIRHHDAVRYIDDEGTIHGEFPAMLALIRKLDGTVVGIHRTYLSKERVDKLSVDKPKKVLVCDHMNGAAVKMFPVTSNVIGIAEGIETALAARTIFGNPVWPVLNANGVATFEPPSIAELVVVYADNDESGTGQLAAYTLKSRLHKLGIKCLVMLPKDEGKDWADVWNEW